MSSNEDDYNDGDNSSSLKKRRIQRACDICRRKKIRCDGVHMPGNRCSNCVTYNYECTYVEAAKKRGPPKGYVESLEVRVEKLERLLQRLCPDESVLKQLNAALEKDNWTFERQPTDPSPLVAGPSTERLQASTEDPIKRATCALRHAADDIKPPPGFHDDDDSTLILADNLKKLAIDPNEYRFFGKSSGAMLIQTAIELKNEYTHSDMVMADLHPPVMGAKREEYWTLRPWERSSRIRETPKYNFPEHDLALALIDLYFEYVNLYLPLLHRPTFERDIAAGLHLVNESFAGTYLLVCAVGARFSDDPRVLLDGVESYHSAGWKWFDQVQMLKTTLLKPPSLYDLQFYCLSVQFLQGSSAPQSCWTMVGIGIRLAQDVGAHRRKVHSHTLTAEDELWKRAFWALVCMDRTVSAALGRPCAIQDEDFDLDLPVDCDDEYWDHPDPEKRFQQPPGKPSLLSAFRLFLKLNQVLAFSLRTIYSINKSKILLGFVGQQWEQHIVAELDSALNKWVDSVPDHLRWDPNREDDKFFNQSVALYAAYYHIQILIHRPFIPSPSKPSPLSFPSLAICTNAARSCSHVVDVQRKRNTRPPPQIQMAVFTSGIVLLLSIWGGKRSGLSIDPKKEMADVHKCMNVLRVSESRWHSAGRLWDILFELASVGELPLPQASPTSGTKRDRDSETPITGPAPSDNAASTPNDAPRNIAGSRRVNKDVTVSMRAPQPQQQTEVRQPQRQMTLQPQTQSLNHSSSSSSLSTSISPISPGSHQHSHTPPETYALPVYSNDLGRLPLHGQFQFTAQPAPSNQPMDQDDYWYQTIPNPISSNQSNLASSSSMNLHIQHAHPQHEMSTMTMASPYSMDPAAMAAGLMFDSMAATLSYPSNPYDMTTTALHRSIDSNPDGFRIPVNYRPEGSRNDGPLLYNHPHRPIHPHAQPPPPPQVDPAGQLSYPYVDNDTMAMWSNAPTGFELDEWGIYLSNVSELTQHGHTSHSNGSANSGGLHEELRTDR